jgi:hypothetical protein
MMLFIVVLLLICTRQGLAMSKAKAQRNLFKDLSNLLTSERAKMREEVRSVRSAISASEIRMSAKIKKSIKKSETTIMAAIIASEKRTSDKIGELDNKVGALNEGMVRDKIRADRVASHLDIDMTDV